MEGFIDYLLTSYLLTKKRDDVVENMDNKGEELDENDNIEEKVLVEGKMKKKKSNT